MAKWWTPDSQGLRRNLSMARLQDYYRKDVVPDLMKKFGYKTSMQVPRIKKITLNMGVGETTTDKKILDNAVADLTKIAGQKPVVTNAKKSIATFKVRKRFPVQALKDRHAKPRRTQPRQETPQDGG